MKKFLKWILIISLIVGIYNVFKPLPDGVRVEGNIYNVPASSIHFYSDLTYVDDDGIRHSEQEIFDEIFRMIKRANNYILIDMFLYNDFLGTATESHRELSTELTELLIKKKKENPEILIQVITDPINEIYGGYESSQLKSLNDAGINLMVTDLKPLRDSNPIYSAFWRTLLQWFGNSATSNGSLANPFDAGGEDLTVRTYFSLLNFKANHRKVVVADYATSGGIKFSTLVTSANPHDGSSAHTNTAIKIDDLIWREVIESEQAVAVFSDEEFLKPTDKMTVKVRESTGAVRVQLLTEGEIRDAVVEHVNGLRNGDTFDMAMFYLSDRRVISALKRADKRGVSMRIILDPNKDAFGREKNGVPNRPVAHELLRKSKGNTEIRWCDTHGEQCHTKLFVSQSNGIYTMMQGSANFTRRNIGDYNLETNILVESDTEILAMKEALGYFEKVWNNESGKTYSADYDKYKDDSIFKTILYRVMEGIGTSSF